MSRSSAAVLTKPGFRKIEWLLRDIAVKRRADLVERLYADKPGEDVIVLK